MAQPPVPSRSPETASICQSSSLPLVQRTPTIKAPSAMTARHAPTRKPSRYADSSVPDVMGIMLLATIILVNNGSAIFALRLSARGSTRIVVDRRDGAKGDCRCSQTLFVGGAHHNRDHPRGRLAGICTSLDRVALSNDAHQKVLPSHVAFKTRSPTAAKSPATFLRRPVSVRRGWQGVVYYCCRSLGAGIRQSAPVKKH